MTGMLVKLLLLGRGKCETNGSSYWGVAYWALQRKLTSLIANPIIILDACSPLTFCPPPNSNGCRSNKATRPETKFVFPKVGFGIGSYGAVRCQSGSPIKGTSHVGDPWGDLKLILTRF